MLENDPWMLSQAKIGADATQPRRRVGLRDAFPLFSGDASLDGVAPVATQNGAWGTVVFFDYDAFMGPPDSGWVNNGLRTGINLDRSGPLADPFGTAPGTVALGVPAVPTLGFASSADLTSLAGQTVTLFADSINQDDGFRSLVHFDNAVLQDELIKKSVGPEPSSLALWCVVLAGAAASKTRRKESRQSVGFSR